MLAAPRLAVFEARADAALAGVAARLQAARCAVAAVGAAGATLPLLVFAAPVAVAAAGTYATVGGVAQELLGLPP